MDRWLYTWLLVGAAGFALALASPLLILERGGGLIDVSISESVYTASIATGSLVWGRLADLAPYRRRFLLAGSAMLAISPLVMVVAPGVAGVITGYALGAQAYAIFATFLNLLVVEAMEKSSWSEAVRKGFQYLVVGQAAGAALGVALSYSGVSISGYALASTAIGAICVPLLTFTVKEPPMTMERRSLLMVRNLFVSRLSSLPLLFLRIPRSLELKVISKTVRRLPESELAILTVSNALFYLSMKLFYTVYIPFEKGAGLSDLQVLVTYLYAALVNATATAMLAGELRRADYRLASRGIGIRALGMLAAAAFSLYVVGREVFYTTLFSFTLISFAYTIIVVVLNSLLYRVLPPGRRGSSLGAYSTVGSLSLLVGSMVSGPLAEIAGYPTVYFFSAALLLLAGAMIEHYYRARSGGAEEFEVL